MVIEQGVSGIEMFHVNIHAAESVALSKTEWQKTEYLPSTEAGICHEFLYVPRETFFILFHVVWKWITFITVKTLNRPDELLCGLFLLFASRVLRFGKSIV